jgi:hypothetical protein
MHSMANLLLGLLALIGLVSACTVAPKGAPQGVDWITRIADDMRLPHEGRPHGVPDSFDWSAGPRMGMGNNPGAFKAFIAWGQIYEAAEGNPATNTRVQIRDMRAYILSKADGQWHLVQGSTLVSGAAYREDFSGDESRPADIRSEPDGTISVTAGEGHNFHFWPASGRVSIDPDDIAGVLVTAQTRLVLNDPDGPDDRDRARYVMGVGADYWQSLTAQWDQWKTNGDVGIGRFRYVTPEWQTFTMSSLSEDALRQNPPPDTDFRN